jgi:L-cysteine/cystine lyase
LALSQEREKYSALQNKNYLNFGAQGTLANETKKAIFAAYDFVQEHGPLSAKMFGWIVEQVNKTREALAAELGGEPKFYALTANATEGCNIALWGFDWQEGDVLLTTDCEHNGVMAAAKQLSKRKKIKLEICKIQGLQSDEQILNSIEEALARANPRMFMLSHILWNSGIVLPLEKIVELCKAKNVRVLADGAQSVGVLPLNLAAAGADYYAFTGHKWFCGPEGIGGLYVAPDAIDSIEPTFAGWRSVVFDTNGNPDGWLPGAARFEVATAPFPLMSGLQEAIKVHRQFGDAKERHETILKNAEVLRKALKGKAGVRLLDEQGGSSLVSFTMEGARHAQIVKDLEEKKIILRTIPNPDCIRASVHYFSAEDVNKLMEALEV